MNKNVQDYINYDKKLEESKKREYYRETVKKRNIDLIEEKKNRTIWKLEKIELKAN